MTAWRHAALDEPVRGRTAILGPDRDRGDVPDALGRERETGTREQAGQRLLPDAFDVVQRLQTGRGRHHESLDSDRQRPPVVDDDEEEAPGLVGVVLRFHQVGRVAEELEEHLAFDAAPELRSRVGGGDEIAAERLLGAVGPLDQRGGHLALVEIHVRTPWRRSPWPRRTVP